VGKGARTAYKKPSKKLKKSRTMIRRESLISSKNASVVLARCRWPWGGGEKRESNEVENSLKRNQKTHRQPIGHLKCGKSKKEIRKC